MSSDQGYAIAQNNLGVCYYYGEGGLVKDLVQAKRLFRLAADQGHESAKITLSTLTGRESAQTGCVVT
jgi:TPR repeat protein